MVETDTMCDHCVRKSAIYHLNKFCCVVRLIDGQPRNRKVAIAHEVMRHAPYNLADAIRTRYPELKL